MVNLTFTTTGTLRNHASNAEYPQETLRVLDIALREDKAKDKRYVVCGSSIYTTPKETKELELIQCWKGFCQSLRQTAMGLALVFDIATVAFIPEMTVLQYLELSFCTLKNIDVERIREKLKPLHGLKVKTQHTARIYRIRHLTNEKAKDLRFQLNSESTTVKDFFKTFHMIDIVEEIPCLKFGKEDSPIYMPMELCNILKGQRSGVRLLDSQKQVVLNAGPETARARENQIIQTLKQNEYDSQPCTKEFGLKVGICMTSVQARVLRGPKLTYHTAERSMCKGEATDVRRRYANMKCPQGGKIHKWAYLDLSSQKRTEQFKRRLTEVWKQKGLTFEREPFQHKCTSLSLQDKLKELKEKTTEGGVHLDLLLVLIPNEFKTSDYGDLKRTCETELGFVSQCLKIDKPCSCGDAYINNVILKINVKTGGKNTYISDLHHVNETTMIFGADVTHPLPSENSVSIAAVVATQDSDLVTYSGLVSAQQSNQEMITNMKVMTKDLIDRYVKVNGKSPTKIIFYRDGVSEGQFTDMRQNEIQGLIEVCKSVNRVNPPKLTFVVVQKRHHTRFFWHKGESVENIPPGTVVDEGVVDKSVVDPSFVDKAGFNFYLCSHKGLKGTNRVAHYHLLYDDNGFSQNDLQNLSYHLCYTYARCKHSISIVPAARYAHLLAFRARFYRKRQPHGAKPNLHLHDVLANIKERPMYFC